MHELARNKFVSRLISKARRAAVAERCDYFVILVEDSYDALEVWNEKEAVLRFEMARQSDTFGNESQVLAF